MESGVVALIIIGVMMVLYMSELLPIAVTSVLACIAFAVFGLIPFSAVFAGFGNDIVFLIAGMIIVGNALFETGVARMIGKFVISLVGTGERLFIIAIVIVSTSISLFMSNTATVSIMLPIAASAVHASGGKLTKKNTYMMVGILAVTGGGLTLIGSTPQLIAQGLLQEGGHETMSFFELSHVGLPVLLLALLYFLTIGGRLQKRVFDFPEVEENSENPPAESEPAESSSGSTARMCMSVAALVFCVIGFLSDLWTAGVVAMTGAAFCVISGCISQKAVFRKMDWTTIVIMGCSFGISAGLDQSGGGRMVAQGVINVLGSNLNPWLLCAALAFIAVILTNFMSSTATATLLIPIAVIMATELGYDVKSIVMSVAIAANIGYATPISTPPITMTLAGGYRFMDYVKVGGLLNLLAYILIVLLFPLMLNV